MPNPSMQTTWLRHAAMNIRPLSEHPEFVDELACCFEREWPAWYGADGKANALDELRSFANPARTLPLGIVAISEAGLPCGVAALKATSIPVYAHLSPWATAGYVLPHLRGRGIGAALLSALVAEAGGLGYSSVYCATATARRLLVRVGWRLLEESVHDGKPISLFEASAQSL
jgi:GNAT superfamily N-acetyltransferase